jgi:hypothetical protein
MLTSQGRLVAAASVLAVAVTAGGFWVGRSTSQQADWHSGTAYLMGDPDNPGFSARVGDWTYGAQGSVPHWIDESGALHEGEWPTCLRPPSADSSRDRRVPVRFAEVTVSAEDVSWRTVVMVDCRR